LLERARPRDLYDVINLFERRSEYGTDIAILKEIAQVKFAHKGLPALNEGTFLTEAQEKELIQDWEHMLAHQIGTLDSVQIYLNKLPSVFEWIRLEI